MRIGTRLRLAAVLVAVCAVTIAACGGPEVTDLFDPGGSNSQGVTGTCAVKTFHELMIVHPSVVTDPVRTSDAQDGHWSFRFLMEEMAPASGTLSDPSLFVEDMLHQWVVTTSINGFPLDTRTAGITAFLSNWPKRSDGHVDLAKAPFRLMAIVYRPDLANPSEPNGEGRFVFDADEGGSLPFTMIFEFRLPTDNGQTLATWADRFHSLGKVGFGSTFNSDLQAITDLFAKRGTSATRINKSSINQVRTNEIFLDGFWQLREFRLTRVVGALHMNETKQSPDTSLNPRGGTPNAPQEELIDWINSNASQILAGTDTVPTRFLGGRSDETGAWNFGTLVPSKVRAAFAKNTCNGCHNGEVQQIDGFYQISPERSSGVVGTSNLSGFLLLSDLPRRNGILKGVVCTAGTVALTGTAVE